MRVGAHLSIARGYAAVARSAVETGCETVQVFTRSPRGRAAKPLDPVDVRKMRRALSSAGIEPLIVHAPYFVAPASEKPDVGELAVQIIAEDCLRAGELGAPYVVVHAGHHRGGGSGPALVARRLAQAAGSARAAGVSGGVEILLENGPGSRGDAAGNLDDWAAAVKAARESGAPVGACIDTAHLWAAGVDLSPGAVDGLVSRLGRLGILDVLRVVHLNDCSSRPGGGRDRHDHIGEGDIPLETFRLLLRCPSLSSLPAIVETRDEDGLLRRDVEMLKGLRSQEVGLDQ